MLPNDQFLSQKKNLAKDLKMLTMILLYNMETKNIFGKIINAIRLIRASRKHKVSV
jgi:hypothetical protein